MNESLKAWKAIEKIEKIIDSVNWMDAELRSNSISLPLEALQKELVNLKVGVKWSGRL